ncbi:MAG: hypothetical protein HN904_17435, partial [Victivallales bacterium]|nr:hypothetical protein [Victivallales bacterium]
LPFLYSLVRKTSGYGNLEKNDTIIWNHTTFPLLGLYWGGRYFRRYYDSVFMDTFLKKAEGAFRGQETCWKPQCDADSYLTLTIGHMIEYALAEDRMAFFESGNIRLYADYLIGICDNRGWAAGFGDSGMVRSTAIPDAGLPYAFWYTKDPRYLGYLNSIRSGDWVNPYHQDVAPEAPEDSVGLRVYPLHRQVYEYTIKRPYYGEPSGPPNIPFEQAFDKIAFRQDLQTTGQYLLLDGYSRGKHLHYDGNAILKLADKGEDWLVDGDYLVRNTTEHTMVSVIRDGRAEKLVPECAGLLHEANLPGFGLTETQVKDYNGVDWRRDIFWRKGEWFVLIDRLLARQPGDYRLDCVFKCIDAGREELVTPQRFRISRGGLYRFGNFGLERTQAADGSRSAAVFSRRDAQLQFTVRLTKGQYRVTVLGAGPSTGADSLWLRVDGRKPVAFHLPVDKVGPSSSAPSKTAPTPEVTIDTTDDFAFTFALRENAGSVLERVVVEDVADASRRQEFLPFKAPPVSKRLPDETRRFHIVNADGANLSVARRTGSSGPVKYLFERRAAQLKPGQTTLFGNLLYSEDIGERKDWTTTQLTDSVVLAQVGTPVLVGATSFDSTDLQVNAALFCISSESVALADATSLSTKAARLTASAPIDVELDPVAKRGTVVATVPTEVTLPGDEQSVHLKPGRHVLPMPGAGAFHGELAAALQRIARGAGQRQARNPVPGAPVAARAWREMWRIGEPDAAELPEIRDVEVARLSENGPPHVFVCRGSDLLCLTGSGAPVWTFSTERRLRCVTIADLDGNGVPDVLCGGDDEHIRILDTAGKEKAKHRMVERLVVGQGGTRLPYVNCLATEDLDGDGHPEIIAGCTNSQISAFDQSFSQVWNFDGVFHGVREVRCADLDDDGRPEVLAADHYGSVNIISADGKTRTRVYSELGDVAFGTGDMDGDGRRELVNGSSTGALSAYAYPAKRLFTFNNYGYAVRAILLVDTDGDGKDETLVASDTGYLYALDAKGVVKWQADL